MPEQSLFDYSREGRSRDVEFDDSIPLLNPAEVLGGYPLRSELPLPELSEVDVVRHFTRLSQRNYAVDTGFYPLGSCTMKYNPKLGEEVASLTGFADVHPLQPVNTVQGSLQLMYELQDMLRQISGMAAVSLQPAAGAHGELAALLMTRAFHASRSQDGRRKVIVPDSAHGTNPASASMAGFSVVGVQSDARGGVDLDELRRLLGEDTAALMLTVPNTLGVLDENLLEITRLVHQCGAVAYCDGANLNAILGRARVADFGFDLVQFNLHKTFGAPHGGGGPGSGPVGCAPDLAPFLPTPLVSKWEDGTFYLDHDRPLSIGRVKAFHGQFGVMLKAYAYLRAIGVEGLRQVSGAAVLNANYLRARLEGTFPVPYDRVCMHEFVLSGAAFGASGVHTVDIAKRLIDKGFHPPTVYFPLIVEEALMIEPTETESKETLDAFADALIAIAEEAGGNASAVRSAPQSTEFGRFDEVEAARRPRLCS